MTYNYPATQIGGLAKKSLSSGSHGKVMGITSSGVFLNSENRILFLTDADYRSPYNIQVERITQFLSRITVGDPWKVDEDFLEIGNNFMRIDLNRAKIWSPITIKKANIPGEVQNSRMRALIDRFNEMDPSKGWLFLSKPEKDISAVQDLEHRRILSITDQFITNVQQCDKSACLESARSILGLGGGLTPSGDDWITGFFLFFACQNRLDPFLADLGISITEMAFECTTKISANRIEAACQGWAEEIFLDVIHYLLISNADLGEEKVLQLFKFGHSSGVDTCMGIQAALQLSPASKPDPHS